MSVENSNQTSNNLDTKEQLSKWNVDLALSWLEWATRETLTFANDNNKIRYELSYYQEWEDWENITNWFLNILNQNLNQQELIA